MAIAPHFMPQALKAIRDIVSTTVTDLKRLREEFVKKEGNTVEGVIAYQEEELLQILPDVVKSAIVSAVLYKESYEFLLRLVYNYIERFRVAGKADQAFYPYEIINPYIQLVIDKLYSEIPNKTTINSTDRKILNTGLVALKAQTKVTLVPWLNRYEPNLLRYEQDGVKFHNEQARFFWHGIDYN